MMLMTANRGEFEPYLLEIPHQPITRRMYTQSELATVALMLRKIKQDRDPVVDAVVERLLDELQ